MTCERGKLTMENKLLREAIIAMAEDCWLLVGPEGISSAQEKCYKAYRMAKETSHDR